MFLFHCFSCCVGYEKQQCHTKGGKNQSAKIFESLPKAMMLGTFGKSSRPHTFPTSLFGEDGTVVGKDYATLSICKSQSLEWIMKLIFIQVTFTSGVQLAILCRISFPRDQGKTLYWMQVNSVLSSCLGKRPLKTSCLSEALTSSALIPVTSSGRLFISPFSQNHRRDWFEGDWSLAVWSIQLTMVKTDTTGIWRLSVCYVTCSEMDTKCQRLNMSVFINKVAICTLMHVAVQVN